MKAMKRRLLSLFMAMVMVCTLVPVALATGETVSISASGLTNGKVKTGNKVNLTANVSGFASEGDSITYRWSVGSDVQSGATSSTFEYTASTTGTISITVKETKGSGDSAPSATDTCTFTVENAAVDTIQLNHTSLSMTTADTNGKTVTATVKDQFGSTMSDQEITTETTSDSCVTATASGSTITVKPNGKTGTSSVKVEAGGKSTSFSVTVSDEITIEVNPTQAIGNSSVSSSKIEARYGDRVYLTVAPTVKSGTTDVTDDYTITCKWKDDDSNISGETGKTYNFDVYGTYKISCDVTATSKTDSSKTKTASASWTVTVDSDLKVSATVSGDYFFGDADDKSNDTVWEKIEDELRDVYDNKCTLMSVRFDETEHKYGELSARYTWYEKDDFDSIEFTADGKGSAEFPFEVEYEDKNERSKYADGILTITVTDTVSSSKGDITYTAELGEDFYFDVSDFEDYFDDKFSSGSLDYVIFDSASNGKVKDGRTTVDYGKDEYYVDPVRGQDDLADVYFSPNSSSKAMTGKVNFTVYGTKSSQSREGTIVIYYLNDSAKDITYNTTGGKVTLDPKDFEDAYKEATGSKTAPSGLTIEFQNVPTNGTLTYTGGSRDKDLTKSTVKSNRYSTKSSGSYRLAQLTYSGTKGTDTIDYIAYSGGTAQFSGKVVFNGAPAVPTDVVVGPFYSTAGQPAAFNLNTFTAASSAISNAVKVRFVAPANGTLTMSGASAAGIDVATSLLNLVSYQPKAGYNGTDQIIFAAYDAKNAVVASGTVNVQVIGNPTTTTPTTPGGSTGVTDVSQFKDVASGAWYRDNLATLVKKGVISGRGDGKFDPRGTVTYGEALKMVLEACGYTAVVGTGSQWAINYKNLAVSRGWISNDIDLNAAISRNATAELAARVLGVERVTSGSPFADDANAYAVALYYTTPQIFVGTTNPNGGKPLFENNKPLLREQVCAVICRVMDYHTQHTTNTMPDGI